MNMTDLQVSRVMLSFLDGSPAVMIRVDAIVGMDFSDLEEKYKLDKVFSDSFVMSELIVNNFFLCFDEKQLEEDELDRLTFHLKIQRDIESITLFPEEGQSVTLTIPWGKIQDGHLNYVYFNGGDSSSSISISKNIEKPLEPFSVFVIYNKVKKEYHEGGETYFRGTPFVGRAELYRSKTIAESYAGWFVENGHNGSLSEGDLVVIQYSCHMV